MNILRTILAISILTSLAGCDIRIVAGKNPHRLIVCTLDGTETMRTVSGGTFRPQYGDGLLHFPGGSYRIRPGELCIYSDVITTDSDQSGSQHNIEE